MHDKFARIATLIRPVCMCCKVTHTLGLPIAEMGTSVTFDSGVWGGSRCQG